MKILLIDDDCTNLDLFEHMLGKLAGVACKAYTAPRDALAWCRNHIPDLVLVDYMMPEMDGLGFLQAFRALPGMATVPVIMVTADVQVYVRHEALRLGASDFLTKPVSFSELKTRTSHLLTLRRAQLQAAWADAPVRKEAA